MTKRKPISEINPARRAGGLEAQLRTMREHYESACQTIASLHAAAVGEVRAPVRGVVEDVADAIAAMREERDRLAEIIAEVTAERDWFKRELAQAERAHLHVAHLYENRIGYLSEQIDAFNSELRNTGC